MQADPKPTTVDSLFVLGVRIDAVTFEQVLASIEEFIADGRPHQIVTVNPEFVMAAQSDVEFRHIINSSALALPDGVGVWWASRHLGRPLSDRIPGVDLVERLAALSAHRGYRLFFLGAMPDVADEAVEVMRKRYPGMAVAGTYAGSPLGCRVVRTWRATIHELLVNHSGLRPALYRYWRTAVAAR